MIKVTEQPMPIRSQSFGKSDHGFQVTGQSSGDPSAKKAAGGPFGWHFPEAAKIFLEKVGLEKRPIEVFNLFEIFQGVVVEIFTSFEKEETTSFEDFPIILFQFLI